MLGNPEYCVIKFARDLEREGVKMAAILDKMEADLADTIAQRDRHWTRIKGMREALLETLQYLPSRAEAPGFRARIDEALFPSTSVVSNPYPSLTQYQPQVWPGRDWLHDFVRGILTMRTGKQIVDQTNDLARMLYALRGYSVREGYRFDQATHPHETEAWKGACEAQMLLTDTDPNDALDELEDDNGGCPPDCGHTPSEHQAFDRGNADGRRDGIEVENPYDPEQSPEEWDAWETGKSVGAQEHISANA